ncbi:unnamed protein product [Ascophyllum nodosum]
MVEPIAPPSTIVIGNEAKKGFLEWSTSEPGIEICPDIDMFHVFKEGYRGVMATKDIAAGVTLVRIARRCCIGPETADASLGEWREAMASAGVVGAASVDGQKPMGPPLTRACFTVLRLLHERGLGKASPFSAYLSVLPLDHRLPMEWNESEVELLKGTSAEPLVSAASLDSQFEAFERVVALHPSMWDPSVCSKTAFAKGVNWVRSRGFTAFGDPHMIPGADMFNHDPNKQSVQIGTDGDDYFVMKTVHPVKAGQEVFSSFGNLSNAQLLNSYGFVLTGNPFDSVLIPTELVVNTCHATFLEIEGDKLGEEGVKVTWERRLAMVAKGEGEGGDEAFVIAKYNLVPENLLDTVQLLTMSNDEEVAYAAIAAVAQAKIEQYSSVLDRDKRGVCSKQGGEVGRPIGADARAAAEMLVAEEKAVLVDLKLQLMGAIMQDDDLSEEEEDEDVDGDPGEENGAKPRKRGKSRKKRRKKS